MIDIKVKLLNFSNSLSFIVSAIVKPFSTLGKKKLFILLELAVVWILSVLISLPEALVLNAISFLNQKNLFPCVTEVIFALEINQNH